MICLCYFLHNDYIFRKLGPNHSIFKIIHNLAIYNDSAKSKFFAKICVTYLSTHEQLKQYYESLGWSFKQLRSRDKKMIISEYPRDIIIAQNLASKTQSEEVLHDIIVNSKYDMIPMLT